MLEIEIHWEMTELEVIVQMDKLQSTYCFSAIIIRSYWKNFETSRNRNVIKIKIVIVLLVSMALWGVHLNPWSLEFLICQIRLYF